MKILYIGEEHGTSAHRIAAFRRLGHHVESHDPRRILPASSLMDRWLWHTGGFGADRSLAAGLARRCSGGHDVAWVNQGAFLGPAAVAVLRGRARRLVNYTNDDPFGPAGWRRFRAYRRALGLYDHLFVARDENLGEALRAGAQAVDRFVFTADEFVHHPLPPDDPRLQPWSDEVVFAGTWFPERGPFLLGLVERGVPLRIFGSRWTRAPEFRRLQDRIAGRPLDGAEYTACIQGARASLCLLCVGNRDKVTRRSAEIPAAGGVLVAPRTSEHARLFRDGVEALLFDDVDECAAHLLAMLGNRRLRDAIANAGRQRILADGRMNEDELARLLTLCRADPDGATP